MPTSGDNPLKFSGADRFALARAWTLRGLAGIYAVAFTSLLVQLEPLLGSRGLTPVRRFLDQLEGTPASTLPTLFWLDAADGTLTAAALAGLALALAALAGVAHAALWAALWALYLSFCNVGQIWYGYGWEILLLEAGFLAIFLSPVRSVGVGPSPVPVAVLWLYRWLVFRLMFGAGLIKIRGDPCWRELTCLDTHFETQPLPNPLSWAFHHLPPPLLHAMTAWNHVVELIVPFLFFGPRPARRLAVAVTIHFQATLILSGNLSFLNWLTIVLCLPALDDGWLGRVSPRRWREGMTDARPGRARRAASAALVVGVAVLSVEPVGNLLSPGQRMNASFSAWRLVNTYGAFGSVGRERTEVILEGTADGERWLAYEFPFKPGDPARRPPVIAPFQPRLDWQIWFAAQQAPSQNLWLVHLVDQLLRGEPGAAALLAHDPFPDRPPRAIRAEWYRYRFTEPGEAGWWHRERLGPYVRPLTVDDPLLVELRAELGWDR